MVAVNNKKNSPIECIKIINSLCEKYSIGRDIHVGDTIIGIKGRVGFEAGGPIVILKSHHLLEKHVLTKWQQFQKDQLDFYGDVVKDTPAPQEDIGATDSIYSGPDTITGPNIDEEKGRPDDDVDTPSFEGFDSGGFDPAPAPAAPAPNIPDRGRGNGGGGGGSPGSEGPGGSDAMGSFKKGGIVDLL